MPKSVCVNVGASRPLLQHISVGPHVFSADKSLAGDPVFLVTILLWGLAVLGILAAR